MRGFTSPFSSSPLTMSLSDMHPYAQFVVSGLRSPSLAKARVDVGDNTNAYLASVDCQGCSLLYLMGHQRNNARGGRG